jgi:quercetin dioxygenase-like cupin family protein
MHPRYKPRSWRSLTRLLLALVPAALVVTIASAQQQQGRGGGGNFANNFTGEIAVADSSNMRMSRIRFEAGARTNWHLHSTGQLLLIEEGRGRVQELGGAVRTLETGQPVYTTPNVLHWHGAAPDQAALQFSVYSGSLDWKQAVTDVEYQGR